MRRKSSGSRWALGFALAAAALMTWGDLALAASKTICQPGLVRRDGRVIPVAWTAPARPLRAAAPAGGKVRLHYIAHSSFLITAPNGTRILTDPYYDAVASPPPDVVTVSNYHETHSATGPYEKKKGVTILYGETPEGRPIPIDRMFGGVRVFAFPQAAEGTAPPIILNTIFVFKVAGLCFAHFGNARFGPSLAQIRALGKIHVMMVPIDGSFTVPHEVAAKLTRRIGPNIVVPMHHVGPELPAQFSAALAIEGIDRIVRAKTSEVTLSLRRLPAPTVYLVMPSDEPY